MLTIQQINHAIMMQSWTNTELTSMIDAIKWNRSNLAKRIKRSISVGDQVEFTSNKTGRTMRGSVTKVAIKYITVRTATGLWRVPANMLTLVEDREYA
jgi:hypothetical protein